MRALLLTLACALGAAGVLAPAAAAAPARTVCHLHDPRIDEASGLARGLASPGVVYVANDSGDSARFFALDARTCATAATITVRGARNVDWEDLAVARDAAGTPSVWLGDLGDNDADRPSVAVYRVAEPRLAAGTRGAARTVDVAATWRLRYPGGPVDAESLAVAPGGAAYVVTKSPVGASQVYRVPPRPAPGVQPLRRVAPLRLAPVGRSRFGIAGALAATGAAFSPDGRRFAVRTYSGAFVWAVRGGDLAAALRTRPVAVTLPPQRQGEGVALDAGGLLLDSEGVGSAVLAVPLPAAAAASATQSAPRSASQSAARSPASPSPSGSGTGTPAGSSGGSGSWVPGLVILGLLLVGVAAWWAGQRRPARGPDH